MGSYAQCWLGDFFVGSSKNDVDPNLISLFREEDKRVVRDKSLTIPDVLKHWLDEESGQSDSPLVVYYSTPAKLLRDRLELFGYTLETAKRVFRECCQEQAKSLADTFAGKDGHLIRQDLAILHSITPESWMAELAEIKALNLKPSRAASKETLRGYMLSEDWYGYPGIDLNVVLRLAIEVSFEATELIYDVTDLVLSGYFDEEDDLVSYSYSSVADEFVARSKIIVLTEGRTDSWILSEAMVLLYPHLAEYFSFMDFEGSRSAGGVGTLVNLVKAFAGAGIVNRTLAIFDNDTAARTAIQSLDAISLPKHMVVLRLPELEILKSYPTLGPAGMARVDVNGMAASIELMLGRDVLADEEYGLVPVQWTGYEQRLGCYQGEVLRKQELHAAYKDKLERARQEGIDFEGADWDGIRAVFQGLFTAFHKVDEEALVALTREYLGA